MIVVFNIKKHLEIRSYPPGSKLDASTVLSVRAVTPLYCKHTLFKYNFSLLVTIVPHSHSLLLCHHCGPYRRWWAVIVVTHSTRSHLTSATQPCQKQLGVHQLPGGHAGGGSCEEKEGNLGSQLWELVDRGQQVCQCCPPPF